MGDTLANSKKPIAHSSWPMAPSSPAYILLYSGNTFRELGSHSEGRVAIDRRTSTPLYLQLKDAVMREIRDGALKPGDRVGSEAEMERRHGVSRITVRQAINALVQEGALYRVPGKGTYVAAPKVAPLAAFTSFSENMAAQGLTPSYRLLAAELVMPPADVRQELRLGERDRAWRIERLLLADGEPMGLQYGYYPQRFLGDGAGAIAPGSLATTSLYASLEGTLDETPPSSGGGLGGEKLWKAEETVEPAIANRKEVKLLGIPPGAPVLVVRRLAYLSSGEPVESVKLVFRGDTYRYRVNLFRGQ
jgi:GntR family transcriptional regulator